MKCDASFQKLWLSYKTKPLPSSTPAAAPKRVSILQGRNDHIRAFTSSSNKQPDDDEYQRWKAIEPLPEDHPLAEDPILYWWQERTTRPRLAKLALDILTIPAISNDCKWAFSEVGDLLKPRQLRLKPDILAALLCTKSFKKMDFQKAAKKTGKLAILSIRAC